MNILKTASVAIICGLVMVSAASLSAQAAMTGSGSIDADVVSANGPESYIMQDAGYTVRSYGIVTSPAL